MKIFTGAVFSEELSARDHGIETQGRDRTGIAQARSVLSGRRSTGETVLDDVHTKISAGIAVLVPAGMKHNIINTGSTPLKHYTLYAPPNHRDGVVHHTHAEPEKDTETSMEKRRNRDSYLKFAQISGPKLPTFLGMLISG